MSNLMRTEPARAVSGAAAAVTVLVTALVAMALGFGWIEWSSEQVTLVMGVVAAVSALTVGVITRGKVWAPETVKQEQVDSFEEGAARTVAEIKLDPGNDYGDNDEGPVTEDDGDLEYSDDDDLDLEDDHV